LRYAMMAPKQQHAARLRTLLRQLSPAAGAACPPSPAASAAAATVDAEGALDASLRELLEGADVPSFVGAIVIRGEVVHRFTHGEATPTTLFHMASVSKTFVAVAVMQLVQEELLQLDDTIVSHLPWWSIHGERADEITIRQLLTHTAGMPDVEDYGWDQPEYDDGALERWLRGPVATRSLLWAPGSRDQAPADGVRGSDGWAYSNIAFELLAALVAELRGTSFEVAVAQHVLAPLGFDRSTFLLSEAPASQRLQGYTKNASSGDVRPEPNYPYNRRHAGSSTLNASLEDMSRWLAYFTSYDNKTEEEEEEEEEEEGPATGAPALLSPDSVREMWREQREMPQERDGFMAVGWMGGSYAGQRVLSHSGSDDGFVSKMSVMADAVRKTPLFEPALHLYIKCFILPRQARDKRRENSKKSGVFRRTSVWC
jgi:CubicO group peptidase (beta-lactamase class C family)